MKAYELLDKPEKWTQGTSARNHRHLSVDPNSPSAVCFCLLGAIDRCYPNYKERIEVEDKIRERLAHIQNVKEVFISEWNDNYQRTFEEVHNLLKTLDV